MKTNETSNIFYFKRICNIGGTEVFLWEIAKKYNGIDITIYYDDADEFQLQRLSKLVHCRRRVVGEKVKCKKAFFNFNIDMIDDVEAEEYTFVSHAIYQELGYQPPILHPKLTRFICVSQYSADKLEEFAEKLGLDITTEVTYNPLQLEPKEKVIRLVTASRLDDNTKGANRILTLIDALDRYCERTGRHYIFEIFSDTKKDIPSPNVAKMKPRVDVRPYIADADYLIQLSNNMETYCYSINEALGYGVPIVTTPLTVLQELPVTNNEVIYLDWDCSNVDEVAEQIFTKKVKPFKYTPPADRWDEILYKKKSNYQQYIKQKVKIQATTKYYDMELKKEIKPEDKPFTVSRLRADYLIYERKLCKEVE